MISLFSKKLMHLRRETRTDGCEGDGIRKFAKKYVKKTLRIENRKK